MKTKFYILVIVLVLNCRVGFGAASLMCKSSSGKMELNITQLETAFPEASIHGQLTIDSQKTNFQLKGWYSQHFDFTQNKQYVGYFIPFDGNPAAADNFIQTWFEIVRNKESETGMAEIQNFELTGTNDLVKFSCSKVEQ